MLGATEGSGCTTMSVNLAFELARLQKRPCILGEQAVAFGRLANYLHINPPLTLYDLVSELDQLDAETMRHALFPVDEHLSVLVGSYLTIRPFTITPEVAFKVLACTMELAETVVVDARHNFDDVDFEFASKVHHLVLVAKPTNPSLNNLRTLLETVAHFGRAGVTYVVINQYESGNKALSKETIERYLNVPSIWLVTADAAAVQAAENSGQTLRKALPDQPGRRRHHGRRPGHSRHSLRPNGPSFPPHVARPADRRLTAAFTNQPFFACLTDPPAQSPAGNPSHHCVRPAG